MLREEAKWIGNTIIGVTPEGGTVLNVGSATETYRSTGAPYQNEFIFHPLSNNGIKTIHTDIKEDEGVDIAGDLTDPGFLEKLQSLKVDVVLCSNLLEHIEDRQPICDALVKVTPQGGYLLITVPYRYPMHYDPIDTMFRPNIPKLHALFPGTELVKGEIVKDKRRYIDKMMNEKPLFLRLIFRSLLPFYKPKVWWNTVNYWPYLFTKFQTTCILLRKL